MGASLTCSLPPPPIPQDMLEFPAQELRKYFKMGDHVKVIAGRFEGDTGLIVRVEENFIILFSDLTMHEVGVWKGVMEGACAERKPRDRSLRAASPSHLLPAAEGAPPGPAAVLRDSLRCGRGGPA